MALRVWLPLDTSDRNIGASGASATRAVAGTFTSAGKVTATSWSSGQISIPYTYHTTGKISFATWVKPNSATAWSDIFGWGATSIANRIEITANGGSEYRFYGTGGDFLLASSTVITTAFSNAVWHHFAMVADGSKVRFYLDGAMVKEATQSKTVTASFGGTETVWVGKYDTRPQYSGYFNDFRIYDHALSQKEIRELAKGLTLHYLMSGSAVDAMPNMLTWTKDYTASAPLVRTSSAKDGAYHLGNDSLVTLTPGNDYYVQVKSDGVLATHNTGGSAVTTNFTVWLYLRIQGTSKSVGGYDTAVNLTTNNAYIKDTAKQLYVWKYTAPSNAQDITLRVNTYSDGTTATTVRFWDFKIEEDTYTSYIPGTNQASYTKFGLDATTMPNVAMGGSYPLTLVGTCQSVPSIRGLSATDFNETGYYKNTSVPLSFTALTMSLWFYCKAATTQHFLMGSFNNWAPTNGGISMWRNAGELNYNMTIMSSEESTYKSIWAGTFTADAWHHIAVTWDGTTVKVYLDGTLKNTYTYGSNGICYWRNMYLGNSWFSSTPASETDKAYMSDFRLYATALSADDIKRLYNAPISIANTGVGFASQFDELGSKASFRKTGVALSKGIAECGVKVDRTEPDGSKWMHIVHHNNPGAARFASTDTFSRWVYKDNDRFCLGQVLDWTDRWELMIVQKATSSASAAKYRWVQTKNPNKAVFADVAAANVTKVTTEGYSTHSSYGGIYKYNTYSYYVANNGTANNWYGALGCWTLWNNGLPGYAGVAVTTGYIDMYIRVDGGANWKNSFSIMKADSTLVGTGMDETA